MTVCARGRSILVNTFSKSSAPCLPGLLLQFHRLGLTSVLDLEKKLSSVAVQGSQFIATRALNIGQNTFQFLVSLSAMLYLLFSCCAMALRCPCASARPFHWTRATSAI